MIRAKEQYQDKEEPIRSMISEAFEDGMDDEIRAIELQKRFQLTEDEALQYIRFEKDFYNVIDEQ